MATTPTISWSGVLLRLAFALALVLVTYNPSRFSFYHWVMHAGAGATALKAFAGVVVAIGWILCVRAAAVSLGLLGAVLLTALMATLVWMLFSYHIIDSAGRSTLVWIGLIIVGVVLGVGLSWSLVKARAVGQVEVD